MLTLKDTTSTKASRSDGVGSTEVAVEAKAEALLRQASYAELRHITCRLHDGVLTLRGRVPSYYLKQTAQVLLRSIDGVSKINNQLEVISLSGAPQERDVAACS
jgi:osmotically-inducible protein OsmY